MIRMHHILVVCDDSPNGDHALFTAAGLAQQMGAQLTVAAVAEVNTRDHRRCCGSGAVYLAHTERQDAAARLRRAALLLTDYEDVALITTYGARAPALIDAAAQHDCDLIVVPAPPDRRFARLRARDDTRALRRRATVPILQTPSAAAHSLVRRQHSEPPAAP
jgi:nucleotide-binding universal stress UspA family protein